MTTDVLNDLDSAQHTHTVTVHRRIRELARATAAGEPVDAAELAQALAAANQSPADFRAAVATAEKRITLRARIDSQPKLQAREKELEETIARVEADFAAARKAHEQIVPLTHDLLTVRNAIISINTDRRDLAELANGDPEFAQKERELRQRRSDLAAEERRLDQQLDGRYEDTVGRIYKFTYPSRIREAKVANAKSVPALEADKAAYYERRVKPLEAELAAVRAQFAELEAAEAALREEKCSI